MARYPIFLLLCMVAAATWAQPGQRNGAGDTLPDAREQRRSELREVLKPRRQGAYEPDSAALGPTPVNAPRPSRHLTPQERLELREQLRREQNESLRIRP